LKPSAGIEPVSFSKDADRALAFDRVETSMAGHAPVDVDNDGQPDDLAELEYSSGAGRGCDFNYFEAVDGDGTVLSSNKTLRESLARLQHIGLEGVRMRSCGNIQNRLIRFAGRTYYERNLINTRTDDHWVASMEKGQVKRVCTFAPVITTTLKSIH